MPSPTSRLPSTASSPPRITSIVGGLASLVVEALFERGHLKPLTRIGLPDRYIECGSVPHLQSLYGLTTERMIETIAASA